MVDSQIDYLKNLGITFECGVTVGDGRQLTFEQLREMGYKAFLLAAGTGAWKPSYFMSSSTGVTSLYPVRVPIERYKIKPHRYYMDNFTFPKS